jgi:uncharacterized SAM-binding protein YcdF (DUF218 family)
MPTRWYQRTDSSAAPRLHPWTWILLLGGALLVVFFWGRATLPGWLRIDQPPVAADAIVVLGGGDGSREERGATLYHQGLAPVVISSGEQLHLPGIDETFAAVSANYLVALGVPRDDIIELPTTTSTYDEAVQTLTLARERGWRTVLVTTDAFHTRRAYLTFQKVYRDLAACRW